MKNGLVKWTKEDEFGRTTVEAPAGMYTLIHSFDLAYLSEELMKLKSGFQVNQEWLDQTKALQAKYPYAMDVELAELKETLNKRLNKKGVNQCK